ncbi:unnamed protein product [Vicia faba]|uniref:Uncharacterized protein n=1 Tax=Vicia faba TaxID=3906 RepID=A0AAV0YK42_VICFA|nr:unnamed protein product [Vicia faba]
MQTDTHKSESEVEDEEENKNEIAYLIRRLEEASDVIWKVRFLYSFSSHRLLLCVFVCLKQNRRGDERIKRSDARLRRSENQLNTAVACCIRKRRREDGVHGSRERWRHGCEVEEERREH